MIDVLSYVNNIKQGIIDEIKERKEIGYRAPKLAIITDNKNFAANQSYIRSKTRFADEVGVHCDVIVLNDNDEFISNDSDYDGIIVQYPFRDYSFDEFREYVTDNVPPEKDIDGISTGTPFIPCTPLGIINFMNKLCELYELDKREVVVNLIGWGDLIGKPLSILLLKEGYSLNITRSKTPEYVFRVNQALANIVICAAPEHSIVTELRPNTIYIDCGTSVVDGKLLGNVSRDCYSDEALVTPVPNGVGRLTVLALFKQLMEAYKSNVFFVCSRGNDVYN